MCFIYPPKTPPLRGVDFARLLQNNKHATFGQIKKFLAILKLAGPTRCFSWFKIQDITFASCKPLLQKRFDQKMFYKLQGVLDFGKIISRYNPNPTIIWILLSPQPGGQSWVSLVTAFQRPFMKAEIMRLRSCFSPSASDRVIWFFAQGI